MLTIYLRYKDRSAALSALSGILGYTTTSGDDGREMYPTGRMNGVRYDIDFLSDNGLLASGSELVNILWWGDAPPDFGSAKVDPVTPNCTFAE